MIDSQFTETFKISGYSADFFYKGVDMNENTERIDAILVEIKKLQIELRDLQKKECRKVERNHVFASIDGEVSLSDLFGGEDDLIIIHNMGRTAFTARAMRMGSMAFSIISRTAVPWLCCHLIPFQRKRLCVLAGMEVQDGIE